MTLDRKWLQGFLNLGARAELDQIPKDDVTRQEDTVLRALSMLETRPGVLLADEVGMGKTFEALGVAAAFRHRNPKSRIVVITPGPDLNTKWVGEFSRFKEMYDFRGEAQEATRLSEFVAAVREHPVVVAPVTMFQSGRGVRGQAMLFSLYFHWKGMHWKTADAILARYRGGELERVDLEGELFLDTFTLSQVEKYLGKAFRHGRSGSGVAKLDDLYEDGGLVAFENERAVRNAIYEARFVLAGKLIPKIDLLIVDEAHKLKNPGSLRTRAMREVFDQRFDKALFLTATPFQLDVNELKQVFKLFAKARGAPPDLMDGVEGLLDAVYEYQLAYNEFQITWTRLDPEEARRFSVLYDSGADAVAQSGDPSVRVVAAQIAKLHDLKTRTIEPGFREWMIRSLRTKKRLYRQTHPRPVDAAGQDALPFLIYERYIAELFRRQRQTHKAAAEINMVSSYSAARDGTILGDDVSDIPAEAEPYRLLLREVLAEMHGQASAHPKVTLTIADALNAADQGLKTLVFCSRIATLEQLRREIDDIWHERILDRWRQVYPDATAETIFDRKEEDETRRRGRHAALQQRFHRPQDALYLALRERYLRTVVPIAEFVLPRIPAVVVGANERLRRVRVGKTSADRLDYQVAKRCVEQAAVAIWTDEGRPGEGDANAGAVRRILDPEFLVLGLDLVADEYENDSVGEEMPRWEISDEVARRVIGDRDSLWTEIGDRLSVLDMELRVRVVEQLARYLTFKEVPFLADLLLAAKDAGVPVDSIESARMLSFVDSFWHTTPGHPWVFRMQEFIEYLVERGVTQRQEILDGPIKRGDFVRHTKQGESREKLREAFNTPLYPMVLIANEVMQEGLDLHKQCRRVVHHDLTWNPAQIEQRIGRIDRLGSLTDRLRSRKTEAKLEVKLDVVYPVIRSTIDARMYGVVKNREKWLEFLLGAAPRFEEFAGLDEDGEGVALPERLRRELSVDLGPG